MKWKDVNDVESENLEADRDDYFYEKKPSFLNKFNFGNWTLSLASRPERPFIFIGIGLIILIIVFIALIMKKPEKEINPFESYETKVKLLEEKIARLEKNTDTLATLNEKTKTLEQLILKLNRSETDVSTRIDAIAGELAEIRNHLSQPRAEKTVAAKSTAVSPKQTVTRYHTVRPGETLYRISRQYNIEVNELKRLNKLGSDAVIHPGQKLVVGVSGK